MLRDTSTETSGLLQIAAAATIWVSIPVLVYAVDASSFVIVFWRVVFAAATLAGFLLVRGRIREVTHLPRSRVLALVGMGTLLTVNWILFFTALQLTRVAVAVLLGYLGPVFVALLTPVFTKQPFDRRILVPLVLALAGTIAIVDVSQLGLRSGSELLGAGLAFISAITYSILVLNAKRLVQGIPATVYMVVEYSTASVLLLPFALFMDGPATAREWGALATLGVVNTALTGFIFLSALRRVRADHAAILTYAEPVSAVVFAALFLSEPITLTTVIGGCAVIGAGALVAGKRAGAGVEAPPLVIDDAAESVAD